MILNPDQKNAQISGAESCISLELTSQETLPNKLLQLFKSWDIHTLYLNNNIFNHLHLQKAFKEEAYKGFTVHVNFDPDIKSYLADHSDVSEQILRPRIFCGRKYLRQQKNWGCDLFHFYGSGPEIIPLKPAAKKLIIDDPPSVFRLFFTADLGDGYETQLTDVTASCNLAKQTIKPQSSGGFIIVVRQFRLFTTDKLNQRINYFEKPHLERILKIYKTRLNNRLGNLDHLVFDYDDLFNGNQQNYQLDFHEEMANYDPDLLQQIVQFWLHPEPLFATYSDILNRYFQSAVKPVLDKSAKQVTYRIDVSNPAIQNLALDQSFLVHIDERQFQPDTPYYEHAIHQLKRAESRRMSQGVPGMPVAIHHLLNLHFSFSEKLEQFNHLLVYGANQFHFRFDLEKEIASQLHVIDPCYAAYDRWFSRLNFAGRLLSEGNALTELLILFPGLDNDLTMFNRTMHEIHRSGLDFTLIDFDLFNSSKYSPIKTGKINFAGQKFQLLLLPAIRVVSLETLRKISAFIESGGTVIAMGQVPEFGLRSDNLAEFFKLNQQIWFEGNRNHSTSFREASSGGASYFQPEIEKLPNLIENFKHLLNVQVEASHPGLRYRLREMEDHYTLFVANLNQMQEIRFDIHANLTGRPFYWDFSTHKAQPLVNWQRDEHERLHCRMILPPNQAEFILINKRSKEKGWQVLQSDLDYFQFDEENILSGYCRSSGKATIRLQKDNQFRTVPIQVSGKLPILTISNTNWLLESDNFSGMVNLGDYSKLFPFRSGLITYHKLIVIEDFYLTNQHLLLKFGNLKDWCSLSINDTFVAHKYESPWEFDVSAFLKEGENRISLTIANTLSNRLAGEDDSYKVRDFGLYGPVKIVPSSRVRIDLSQE